MCGWTRKSNSCEKARSFLPVFLLGPVEHSSGSATGKPAMLSRLLSSLGRARMINQRTTLGRTVMNAIAQRLAATAALALLATSVTGFPAPAPGAGTAHTAAH